MYQPGTTTPVDLTTNAGWEQARAYYDNLALAAANLGTATTLPATGADGTTTTGDLPIGLYYVTEVSAPDGYTRIEPFLVTLPMTDPVNTNTWMYAVNVYPKNALDEATKAVVDRGTQATNSATGAGAEHAVDYVITSSITDGLTGEQMGRYVVNDQLDPRVTYTGVTVALSNGTALVAGTDYTVTATGPAGAAVSVTMTAEGLTKLAAANTADPTTTVVTTISATIGDMGNGVVPDTASFIPNAAWADQNPGSSGIPTNEVKSHYGDVQVLKQDANNTATVLQGAEFTVYADANADGTCDTAEMVAANQIAGPVANGTDGVALFQGLQVSTFYNGAEQTTPIYYCLVETKAPTGYNLNAQPIPFTVPQSGGVVDLTNQQIAVVNQPSNLGNSLPLTGGAGVAALSGLGLLLGIGGVTYYVIASRRAGTEEETEPTS